MRIISKFYDYYDIAMSQGIDTSLVYVRETSHKDEIVIPIDMPNNRFNGRLKRDKLYYNNEHIVIGFCGKFFPVIKGHKAKTITAPWTTKFLYSYDEFVKFYTYKGNYIHRLKGWKRKQGRYEKYKKEFYKTHPKADYTLFLKLNTPIFVHERHVEYGYEYGTTINPRLKDYDFYRMIDPYTAYQELAMCLSGVLRLNEKEPVVISDACLARSKGFDAWSFRKQPNGRPIGTPIEHDKCKRG